MAIAELAISANSISNATSSWFRGWNLDSYDSTTTFVFGIGVGVVASILFSLAILLVVFFAICALARCSQRSKTPSRDESDPESATACPESGSPVSPSKSSPSPEVIVRTVLYSSKLNEKRRQRLRRRKKLQKRLESDARNDLSDSLELAQSSHASPTSLARSVLSNSVSSSSGWFCVDVDCPHLDSFVSEEAFARHIEDCHPDLSWILMDRQKKESDEFSMIGSDDEETSTKELGIHSATKLQGSIEIG